MGKNTKTNKTGGSAIRPATLEELSRLEATPGEPDWYNRRRLAGIKAIEAPPSAMAVHRLKLNSLATGRTPSEPLPSMMPPEAPLAPFAPKAGWAQKPRKLRRFSGKKLTPACAAWIYGGDDRRVFRDTSFPWVCTGLVTNTTTGMSGTGALVGTRIVLTAAHVLYNASNATFVPAYYDGTSLLGPDADWKANGTNWALWEGVSDSVVGYDMVVMRLDKPLGSWLGAFGCRVYDDDWEGGAYWTHVGYPCDISPSKPTWEPGIVVEDDDNDDHNTLEIETDADVAKGQSGGPLWGVFDGHRQIIGTLSGHEDNFLEPSSNVFAGGNGLVDLVRWARENWT